MPSHKVHCIISEERCGKRFSDLHTWMDAPYKEHGVNHRIKRHAFNLTDSRYIENRWGAKAVVEWLFHIAIDNLETAYKQAKRAYPSKAFNYFRVGFDPVSKFVYFDEDRLSKWEMKETFKEIYGEYDDDDYDSDDDDDY